MPQTPSVKRVIRSDYLQFHENHVCIRAYLGTCATGLGRFVQNIIDTSHILLVKEIKNHEQKLVYHILMNIR